MNNNKTPKIIGSVTALILLLVSAYFLFLRPADESVSSNTNNSQITTPQNTSPQTTPTTPSPSSDNQSNSYSDGSYQASADYDVPENGNNQIGVQLVLEKDVVKSLTVTDEQSDRESKRYVNDFIAGINGKVVGKKIDEVNVGKINSSSLTSIGFNDAINQIKTEAR